MAFLNCRLTLKALLVRINPKLFGAFLIYAPEVFSSENRKIWLKHHKKHEQLAPRSLNLGWFVVVSVAHVKMALCEISVSAVFVSASSPTKALFLASPNHHGNRPNFRSHNSPQKCRPSKASDGFFALFKTQARDCRDAQEARLCRYG